MRSTRMRRTDDLVRRILSEALLTKVQDPRIGLVSVTRVRVSPEFDTAQVWFSVLGDEKVREETFAGLRSAASFLQSEIAHSIRLRRTPRLRFLYDDSLDRGFRVDAALRDLAAGEGGSTPDGATGEEAAPDDAERETNGEA